MNKKKWLKPVIVLAVLAVIAAGGYTAYQNLLGGRGVSASKEDILNVLGSMKGYLIVIAIVIIAVIAAFIVSARKYFAGIKRLVIRSQSLAAGLIVIVVCVNLICQGPMQALLTVSAGVKGEMSEETMASSGETALQIAREGIILLKNENNALPLSSDTRKLNVFGWSSTNPMYGGTGSGAFDSSENLVTLFQGLEMAGYELNQDLKVFYEKFEDTRPDIGMYIQDWTVPEPKMKDYDKKSIFEGAQEFSDTALIVITRSGGEGADLPMSITDEDTVKQAAATGSGARYTSYKDDVDPERSYLELTNREKEMVERVNESFENVIVIINAANTMELGWVNDYEHINGVIWCPGPGERGFQALGEVLSGTVNPSGKTVDTYLYDLFSSPAVNNIGNMEYDNLDDVVNSGADENYKAHFVNYVENIYVGYKFYETAAEEGLINYDETVQYPFGYGLSYTNFEQTLIEVEEKDGTVTVKVDVKNTGSVAGKEVVEVYYDPPYTSGGIEKASVNLIQFAKTEILEPGDTQSVEVSFTLEDMASYDYQNNGSYVLEAGDYEISIRTDSHNIIDSKTVTVDKDIIYNEDHDGARSTDTVTAVNRFGFAQGDVTYLSRADGFANYEEAVAAPSSYSMSDEAKAGFITNAVYDTKDYESSEDTMPATGVSGSMTLEDLAGKEYDDPEWDNLLDQMTIDEMKSLISMGGYTTAAVNSIGLAATIETDGPTGLHSNFTELEGTNFPSIVMLASTWNKELAGQRGELIGLQGQELGITGWYGPAMNIHRTAFSGRNFEYYSEDAVLSGIMAASEVAGAKKYNMQTYVKHFALNDQECNRIGMLCTWSNEQAIREIYLKPFEMAFKIGGSEQAMSSYNYIGNQWAGACSALLKDVLRGEWGVQATVVTDWYGGYGYMNADLAIRGGGDRMLTTTDMAGLLDTSSATAVSRMREACHNILYSLTRSSLMEGTGQGITQWQQILNYVNIAAAAVVVLTELLTVLLAVRLMKKKKAQAAAATDTEPKQE